MLHRPVLPLDLAGVDGNVFLVIGHARALLVGDTMDHFNDAVVAAILPGSGNTYADILALVNQYVQLVDTSRTYPEYTLSEGLVLEAIEHLNNQIKTLPETVTTLVEDLWPEFGSECGFKNYLCLLEQEIERVEQEIGDRVVFSGEPLQVLLNLLHDCLVTLRQAGKS